MTTTRDVDDRDDDERGKRWPNLLVSISLNLFFPFIVLMYPLVACVAKSLCRYHCKRPRKLDNFLPMSPSLTTNV